MALYNDDEITDITKVSGVLPVRDALPIPVGKIPTHATQIIEYDAADNDEPTIYTVPSNKVFYFTHYSFSIYNTAASAGGGRLAIYNDTPALWKEIVRMIVLTNSGFAVSGVFNPPLELAEDFIIKVTSWAANTLVTGFIHGYEL